MADDVGRRRRHAAKAVPQSGWRHCGLAEQAQKRGKRFEAVGSTISRRLVRGGVTEWVIRMEGTVNDCL